jgi:hypothetical protein
MSDANASLIYTHVNSRSPFYRPVYNGQSRYSTHQLLKIEVETPPKCIRSAVILMIARKGFSEVIYIYIVCVCVCVCVSL